MEEEEVQYKENLAELDVSILETNERTIELQEENMIVKGDVMRLKQESDAKQEYLDNLKE